MIAETARPGARLRMPGEAASLRSIRDFIRGVGGTVTPDADWVDDLVLAVDEACQNIVRHGYLANGRTGDIIIETSPGVDDAGDPALLVTLIDFAPPVDPHRISPRSLPRTSGDLQPGGLGLGFIRVLTDRTEFVAPPPGAGNALRLLKRLPTNGGRENNKGRGLRKG